MIPDELAAIEARHDALSVEQCRADLLKVEAEKLALVAEVKRLRVALESIAVFGCGMFSQPAAMNAPEEVWLRQRIAAYEQTARAALTQEPSND